jgi:hypothetical protein
MNALSLYVLLVLLDFLLTLYRVGTEKELVMVSKLLPMLFCHEHICWYSSFIRYSVSHR